MEGKAVQIIKQNESEEFSRTPEFDKIMNKVGNRKLQVIAIAGDMRCGKSFLLTLLVQYMLSNKSSTWLKDYYDQCKKKKEKPARFHWRAGYKADTKGIWAWSEPFIDTLPDREEVAILFYDCEGAFDPHASRDSCSKMFACSLILSSVHLFNVMKQVTANDMDQLQYFMEFTKVASDTDTRSQAKPFQNIWFVVRDWIEEEPFVYGLDGGMRYVAEELLNPKKQSPEQAERQTCMKEGFENISGILLPPPGREIERGNVSNDARLDHHIEKDYLATFEELVKPISTPSSHAVKKLFGSSINGKQYTEFTESFIQLLNTSKSLNTQSLKDLYVGQKNMMAYTEALNMYLEKLETKTSSLLSSVDDLDRWHDRAKREAQEQYEQSAIRSQNFDEHKTKLVQEIKQQYEMRKEKYKLSVKAKNKTAYTEALNKYQTELNKKTSSAPYASDLDSWHAITKPDVMKQYAKSAIESSSFGEYNTKLEQKMQQQYERAVEKNNKKVYDAVWDKYQSDLEKKTSSASCVSDLDKWHERAKCDAIAQYQLNAVLDDNPNESMKARLAKKMDGFFEQKKTLFECDKRARDAEEALEAGRQTILVSHRSSESNTSSIGAAAVRALPDIVSACANIGFTLYKIKKLKE